MLIQRTVFISSALLVFSDLSCQVMSGHCCLITSSDHLLINKYILKTSFLMEPGLKVDHARCCNKFKFLHLINYSLLTGIDFLYFGSVDQVWEIFNRLEWFGTDTLLSIVSSVTMQNRWSIIQTNSWHWTPIPTFCPCSFSQYLVEMSWIWLISTAWILFRNRKKKAKWKSVIEQLQ